MKFLEYANEVNGCMEVLTSGLIEAATFPPAFISPKLLQLCIDHYDVRSKSIVSRDGNTILSITRETIASIFRLTKNTFVAFHSLKLFRNKVGLLGNCITPLLENGLKSFMEEGLGFLRSLLRIT